MVQGRKPKPTVVKLREGNPGKRPINKNEPRPPKAKKRMPAEFTIERAATADDVKGWKAPEAAKEAAKEYRRLYKELEAQGLLTTLDISLIEAYCQAYGLRKEAAAYVNKMGMVTKTSNGNLVQNPYLAIVNKQTNIMQKIAAEFGMTPSSRSRLDVKPNAGNDPFEDFLNRRHLKA